MEQKNRYLEALIAASANAERAFEAAHSDEFAHYPQIERHTWAAAAIIHCDVLRLLVAFETSTRVGIVSLLWTGDIVSTLFEARKWFFESGNPQLRKIATVNGYDLTGLASQSRVLKRTYPLTGIDAYENYRNKAGHHYDIDFVIHLRTFSEMEFESFHATLLNFVQYAHEWVKLCRAVVSHGHQARHKDSDEPNPPV